MPEVWPVLAAAVALGLLGLVALAHTNQMSSASWLVALLVALGVAGFMFPRLREIKQGVVDSAGFLGITQGVGIWAIGAGIIIGLLAGASGWGTARRSSPGRGFTVIEVAVVAMVVGTIAAVAVPEFVHRDTNQAAPGVPVWSVDAVESVVPGATPFGSVSSNRAAQSEIRSVLLAEKALWLQSGDYTADPAKLILLDPTLNLAASPWAGVTLTLGDTDSGRVCLTRRTDSGDAFSVWEDARGGTYFGTTDLSARCPAAPPASYRQGGW